MARLRIPDEARPGFLALARLTEHDFIALANVAKSIRPNFSPQGLAEELSVAVPSIGLNSIENIIGAVLSIHTGRAAVNMTLEQFLDDVAESLYALRTPPELPIEQFRGRLGSLTAIEGISLSGRAWDLLTENPHVFLDSRIITDIRPVFDQSAEPKPQAAIMMHSLKIAYMDGTDRREFFVSLDNRDLEQLLATIDRAQKKTESLQALLMAADLPYHQIERRQVERQ